MIREAGEKGREGGEKMRSVEENKKVQMLKDK